VKSEALVELLDMSSTLLEATGVNSPEQIQGKSLMPILRGKAPANELRPFVRSEYFDALDPHFTGGNGTFGTMFRTRQHKLCMYHDKQIGELYDLTTDPWEFENLWDSSDHQNIKNQLIREAFDAHVVLTTDMGSPRIAPM
jgi:arylsulfatase A-like enzyme